MRYGPKQGIFKPFNPHKYKGNPTNIIYRSSWELKFMVYLDKHPSIIWWQSEEKPIPYRDPNNGKIRRYFVDFIFQYRDINQNVKTMVVEIKPYHQTKQPVKKQRPTKRYITELAEYVRNQAKWEATNKYCKEKGWEFKILTEYELGIKT
jgi:TnsA endonuclease N terminal